ncbi:hypothetical protein A3860_19270 [Niastella vici]|uniref:Uncharacterized protein n=1 Tax=Niastella vici TaxID=1703345 RepID=A0A1V9G2P7_9BACT|nr:hypothetical protein A3860_19270 [Niastella vici]
METKPDSIPGPVSLFTASCAPRVMVSFGDISANLHHYPSPWHNTQQTDSSFTAAPARPAPAACPLQPEHITVSPIYY